jgi:hypothetical protein
LLLKSIKGSLKKPHQIVEGGLLDWYEQFGGASFQKYQNTDEPNVTSKFPR